MLSLFKKKQRPTRAKKPAAITKPAPTAASLNDVLQGYSLPSFPETVMNALRKFKDPDAALTDIGVMLERDPGVSIRVLKMVNSAAFGLRKNVSHVGHAISLLGRARVEALVVSVAVRDMLPIKNTPWFNASAFWMLAAQRAALARAFAEELHPGTATESFTAGLLQDMAVPVLVDLHKERYGRLYQQYLQNPMFNLIEAERAFMGFDHTSVGKLMARKWQLPPDLIDAVAGHHGTALGVNVAAAVRIVSDLRPSDVEKGMERIAQQGAQHGIAPEVIAELIPRALQDAKEFYQALR